MGEFIYNPNRAASMADIMFASDVFAELLNIRMTSPLFRLTTAEDIIDRIGFHNIGERQQRGLIAMSIDDGISENSEVPRQDLDMMNDAVMVDLRNIYNPDEMVAAGFDYHSIGRPSVLRA